MSGRLKYLGAKGGKRWWRARLTWKDSLTGKQVIDTERKFSADSKALAEAERERILKELVAIYRGGQAAKRALTLGGLVEEWFATVESHGSRKSWGSHVNSKIIPAWGEVKLRKVQAAHLQQWLDNLKGPRGALSYTTTNSVRDCLVYAYRHGIERGYVVSNVAAQTTRRRQPKPPADRELEEAPRKSLTAEQVPEFFAALRRDQGGEYFELVATQLALGCRFGEVSALKVSDVDWATGEVVIRRSQTDGVVGPPKARYARRAVLGPTALQMLRRHRQQMMREQRPGWGDGWLFPRKPTTRRGHGVHQSISTVGHVMGRVYRAIGADPKGKTHVMRHTMNNVARQRVSEALLRRVVGHKSSGLTDRYSHTELEELRELAGVIDGLL